MEHSNKLIEIFAGNNIQAFALKYELEDAGIECMIRNDQEAGICWVSALYSFLCGCLSRKKTWKSKAYCRRFY